MRFLKEVSVPNLCDAGAKVLKDIKPINKNQKIIFGEAITVKTTSNDWGTTVKAISYGRNKIIVIDAEGEKTAIWGGLATLNAKLKGVIAVVIDGSVRDVEEINNLKFPVFSKYNVPNAGKPLDMGEINVPIVCGGELINPGDIIVGDCNGVAVIERSKINEVIENVKKIKEKEDLIKNRIMRGMDLRDILKL
ncbi:RraA family protein [Methanothermococcus sp.]|uniref:RraA family protein n=1 Tax=Methanothermococcus sp. TaxID=2614238 RepID=UPI0025F298DA|nr:RraA family protein [Methanothermococcus sp.]